MIEEASSTSSSGNVTPFIHQFAAAAGQPQDGAEPTVHQALFIANGQPIQGWLSPSGTNLVRPAFGRRSRRPSPRKSTSVSTRAARPTRNAPMSPSYLAGAGKERASPLQELVWAVLASTEFRFNH